MCQVSLVVKYIFYFVFFPGQGAGRIKLKVCVVYRVIVEAQNCSNSDVTTTSMVTMVAIFDIEFKIIF